MILSPWLLWLALGGGMARLGPDSIRPEITGWVVSCIGVDSEEECANALEAVSDYCHESYTECAEDMP